MLVKLKLVNQKKKKEERKMNKDIKDMLDKTISNDKEGFKDFCFNSKKIFENKSAVVATVWV